MKKAMIFPGQGSQYIGMGKDLYDYSATAKRIFQNINDILSFNLTDIMFFDKDGVLTNTENAQLAIMAHSIAILHVLKEDYHYDFNNDIDYVAGHSLGEYLALYASGAFDLEAITYVLQNRAAIMKDGAPKGFGGMVAVLGIDDISKIQKMLDEVVLPGEVCVIANDNCPGQVVVSGNIKSIDAVVERAKDYGAKRALKLDVSGSFHSPIMQKASEKFAEIINEIDFKYRHIPVISNVTAMEINTDAELKINLVKHLTHPVRWRESIIFLLSLHTNVFIEVGPSKVLSGLVSKISPSLDISSLSSIEEIERFLSTHAAASFVEC